LGDVANRGQLVEDPQGGLADGKRAVVLVLSAARANMIER